MTLGDLEQAAMDYTVALRLDPEHVDARGQRGVACLYAGKFEHAAKDLSEAIGKRPDDARLFLHRGKCHRLMKELDAAIADLSTAIQLDAECAEAYRERSLALTEKGDASAAESDDAQADRLTDSNANGVVRASAESSSRTNFAH